jgi:hypothetical protein
MWARICEQGITFDAEMIHSQVNLPEPENAMIFQEFRGGSNWIGSSFLYTAKKYLLRDISCIKDNDFVYGETNILDSSVS